MRTFLCALLAASANALQLHQNATDTTPLLGGVEGYKLTTSAGLNATQLAEGKAAIEAAMADKPRTAYVPMWSVRRPLQETVTEKFGPNWMAVVGKFNGISFERTISSNFMTADFNDYRFLIVKTP